MKPFQSEPQSNDFQTKRFHWPLAELAWRAFLFALVTGVILSFNYRPWGDVFSKVSSGQVHSNLSSSAKISLMISPAFPIIRSSVMGPVKGVGSGLISITFAPDSLATTGMDPAG